MTVSFYKKSFSQTTKGLEEDLIHLFLLFKKNSRKVLALSPKTPKRARPLFNSRKCYLPFSIMR